jgi:hypothetical protein
MKKIAPEEKVAGKGQQKAQNNPGQSSASSEKHAFLSYQRGAFFLERWHPPPVPLPRLISHTTYLLSVFARSLHSKISTQSQVSYGVAGH